MSAGVTLEERKAVQLMRLRGYRSVKREDQKTSIRLLAEMPKTGKKAYFWCIPMEAKAGVHYVKQLKKAMDANEVERGIIIARGGYTPAAKAFAVKEGMELIPRLFPAFEIFKHTLVPKHEVLKPEEREDVLARYRVKPYQLPWIKVSDPAVMSIGARPGDIVRVIRDSMTSGKHVLYRYVVEG